MFGFSPVMMGKSRLPPFALSGTFATDLDGWTPSDSNVFWVSSIPRTSPGAARTLLAGRYFEYVVPKEICGGLTITASIWHRCQASTLTRSLSYKIGAGSFVQLASVNDNSVTYAQISGSFDNPGNDDVTIRCTEDIGSFIIYWDDWEISGS